MDMVAKFYLVGLACFLLGVLCGGLVAWKLDDGAYRDLFGLYLAESRARRNAECDLYDERAKRS